MGLKAYFRKVSSGSDRYLPVDPTVLPPQAAAAAAVLNKTLSDSTRSAGSKNSKNSRTSKLKKEILTKLHIRKDSGPQGETAVVANDIPMPLDPNDIAAAMANVALILPPGHPDLELEPKVADLTAILPPEHPDARRAQRVAEWQHEQKQIRITPVINDSNSVYSTIDADQSLPIIEPGSIDDETQRVDTVVEGAIDRLDELGGFKFDFKYVGLATSTISSSNVSGASEEVHAELAIDFDPSEPEAHAAAISTPNILAEPVPKLTREQKLRKYFWEAAYSAITGSDPQQVEFITLASKVYFHKLNDVYLQVGEVTFECNDLGEFEQKILERIQIVWRIWDMLCARMIGEEDADDIIQHMFPTHDGIAGEEEFGLLVDVLVEDNVLTHNMATHIKKMRMTSEEFEAGFMFIPSKTRPRHRSNHFWDLPTERCLRRTRELRNLVEAAVYNRKEWAGMYYADAGSCFDSYYQAYTYISSNLPVPHSFNDYVRDWTYLEERIIRQAHYTLQLRKRVANGALNPAVYKLIRPALVRAPVIGYPGVEDMAIFLRDRASALDMGLDPMDIPNILILHTSLDKHLRSAKAEKAKFASFQRDAIQMVKEEKERAAEKRASKMAYKKTLTRLERFQMTMEKLKNKISRKQPTGGVWCERPWNVPIRGRRPGDSI